MNYEFDYLNLPDLNPGTYIQRVLTYWVGYSNLIPISLYVVLEMVRLALAYFIKNDVHMYYEPMDKTAICRASDLIEELGQVEFIFSDKTGTLTCNEMEFRKCGINSRVYGNSNKKINEDLSLLSSLQKDSKEFFFVERYVMLLVLCNSVFPVKHSNQEILFQASSPDELALVEAAKALGYKLIERSEGKVYLEVNKETQV